MPDVQVVNALLLYDCPDTTQQFLLQINNALYIPQMEASLIPPIMMRMSGLLVDECPKALSPSPTRANHAIYSPTFGAYFALKLFYHISYLPIRKPSRQEVASDLPLVHLTSQCHRWNPHDETMSNMEHRMTTFESTMNHSSTVDRTIASISTNEFGTQHIEHLPTKIPVSDADAVLPAICSTLHLPTFAYNVSALTSTKRKY